MAHTDSSEFCMMQGNGKEDHIPFGPGQPLDELLPWQKQLIIQNIPKAEKIDPKKVFVGKVLASNSDAIDGSKDEAVALDDHEDSEVFLFVDPKPQSSSAEMKGATTPKEIGMISLPGNWEYSALVFIPTGKIDDQYEVYTPSVGQNASLKMDKGKLAFNSESPTVWELKVVRRKSTDVQYTWREVTQMKDSSYILWSSKQNAFVLSESPQESFSVKNIPRPHPGYVEMVFKANCQVTIYLRECIKRAVLERQECLISGVEVLSQGDQFHRLRVDYSSGVSTLAAVAPAEMPLITQKSAKSWHFGFVQKRSAAHFHAFALTGVNALLGISMKNTLEIKDLQLTEGMPLCELVMTEGSTEQKTCTWHWKFGQDKYLCLDTKCGHFSFTQDKEKAALFRAVFEDQFLV